MQHHTVLRRIFRLTVLVMILCSCEKQPAKAAKPVLNLAAAKLAAIPDDYDASEILFSTDGRHVAYTAKKAGQYSIVIDSLPGKFYGGVADMVFGPDSSNNAYRAAIAEGKTFVVVNGIEGAFSANLGKPVFSPDGRILAYEAKRGEKYVIVAGDKESPSFDMPYAPPLFSADSSRIAYIEQHYDTKTNNVIVCNADMTGRLKGQSYEQLTDIMLSRDRSLLAFIAQKNGKKVVVTSDFAKKGLNEKEGAPYDDISHLALSADGRHTAYFAKRDSTSFLVRDRTEQPYPADNMTIPPLFSADGARLATVASTGGRVTAVVDGKPGKVYDEIGMPAFSPNGALVAYPARMGKTWRLVVNDIECSKNYDMIVAPQFSPDGSKLVYRVRQEGKRFVVIASKDGQILQEQPGYEMVWQPDFAPDGKSIAYGVKAGPELWWKVEQLK